MGQLVNGEWHSEAGWASTDGSFRRAEAVFRNWVTPDGAPGPGGEGGFAAESGRYHLYVSYACPWAHRTLIMRALKGLEAHISISVVHPDMLDDGWTFSTDFPGATGDTLFGLPFLREVYLRDRPDMTGRVTVPVLWDKKQGRIVSNESSEIILMLNSAFNGLTGNEDDYAPEALRPEIDALNARIYDTVNNGVYRAGFASAQAAYDDAVAALFETLDWLEERLARRRYLAGSRPTIADLRLLPTLLRFDPVYHGHFKCNRRKLIEYPNLWAYTRDLYQLPGIAGTVWPDHYIRHYHYSHASINPYRIIPLGPVLDLAAPHGREALGD